MSEHELVLVLDARVDEIAEQPALDPIIRLSGIIDRPVWQAATDEAVSIVAPTRLPLPSHRLATWIDTTHVGADGAPQAPGIARAISINVLEVIEPLGRQSTLRAIAVRRQGERNAIAPSSTHLGGEQFRINLVLVRLEKVFEPDHVRLDHLEHSEAAVQAQLPGFGHQVVLGVVPQDEQPWFARLLVVQRISLGTASNGGHADAVGIAEMDLEGGNGLAVPGFHQRHPVGVPDFPEGTTFGK